MIGCLLLSLTGKPVPASQTVRAVHWNLFLLQSANKLEQKCGPNRGTGGVSKEKKHKKANSWIAASVCSALPTISSKSGPSLFRIFSFHPRQKCYSVQMLTPWFQFAQMKELSVTEGCATQGMQCVPGTWNRLSVVFLWHLKHAEHHLSPLSPLLPSCLTKVCGMDYSADVFFSFNHEVTVRIERGCSELTADCPRTAFTSRDFEVLLTFLPLSFISQLTKLSGRNFLDSLPEIRHRRRFVRQLLPNPSITDLLDPSSAPATSCFLSCSSQGTSSMQGTMYWHQADSLD